MKNHILKITLLLLMSTISFAVLAQDTIFKKDKTKIYAKIYEVNQDDIKFKDFDNQDGPTFILEKTEIEKIVFSNGRIMYMTIDPYSVSGDVEVRNKTRVVKFEFFSPLTDDIAFGYEFMYKVGINVEAKIGIIGVGTNPDAVPAKGAFIKIGPKFLLGSDYIQPGMKYAHGMRGRYLKPEFSMSIFSRTEYVFNSMGFAPQQEVKYGNYGISLVYGRQVILGKTMTIDWYFGLGYAFQTVQSNNNVLSIYDQSYYEAPTYVYGGWYGGKYAPILMSTGITLGYLF